MQITCDFDEEIDKYKLFMKESLKTPELTPEQIQQTTNAVKEIIREARMDSTAKMMEIAKATYEKHKVIEITYEATNKNDKVTDKEIEEMIQKYKERFGLSMQPIEIGNKKD